MNQHRQVTEPTPTWQQSLAEVITDPRTLLKLLNLEARQVGLHTPESLAFPLRVPREYVARMRPGDPHDPLLLQILPTQQELLAMPGFTQDPLQEPPVNKLPGLIHKYQGRVLLTITGACAINCRYCFRRNFPYEDNNPGRAGWEKIAEYIVTDPSITEIIYSGGDPLVAKDSLLAQITEVFARLPQIKRLRIHTRLPIVIPQRISTELIDVLKATGLQVVVVVHANHPNEIDQAVAQSLLRLNQAGITVLNQSVLLKGINDNAKTLAELSEKLFEAKCLPYYLHTLDKVNGSAHFDLSLDRAREIIWQLSQEISGFLVPKLVTEVPGVGAKVPVDLKIKGDKHDKSFEFNF
jgi:EF-P beta-lysylation protein EpmB